MRRGRTAILIVMELALVAVLLLLSGRVFSGWVSTAESGGPFWPDGLAERVPDFGPSEIMLGILLFTGLYGLLQFRKKTIPAFLMVAWLALLPHAAGVWDQNRLDWQRFMGAQTGGDASQSVIFAAGLFLISLVGLFVLYRIISLRSLERLLTSKGVENQETTGVLIKEALAQIALMGAGLLVAVVMILVGTAIGGQEGLAEKMPWAVITIGGGATALLIGFLILFLQGLNRSNRGDSRGAG